MKRISAKDALDGEYFWTDPLPCDPKSLPKYEASHEFQTRKRRQEQQQQHEENGKGQKLQYQQQYPQMHGGPNPLVHGSQNHVVGGPVITHRYGKPRGVSGRFPQGANNNHPNRGGRGYSNGPHPPQGGQGGPYGSNNMPGAGHRGTGDPNFPRRGASAAGRGSNMMSGNRNEQYNWQQ